MPVEHRYQSTLQRAVHVSEQLPSLVTLNPAHLYHQQQSNNADLFPLTVNFQSNNLLKIIFADKMFFQGPCVILDKEGY